ncbi:MAG: sugar phosphate isomerase/epimerase family protein [Chrysiogenia bacterium]
MFEDLFIRVASERLDREAAGIAALNACPEVYIKAEKLKAFSVRTIAATKKILGDFREHTIHAPFMDIWPGSAAEDIRRLSLKKMQQVMEIAAALESKLVVMHFNYDPIYYSQQFKQWLERSAHFFSTLLQDDTGPYIALENIAEPTPYVVLQLMKKAGRPRLIHCFDFGHHQVFARIPFQEWLFYLDPRQHIHFHLHDNNGNSDDHLALGLGSIDWQAAKTVMAGLPCPFSIALEPHAADTMRASAAYYQKNFLTAQKPGC